MLHLPDVSKAADTLVIFINGGAGMGMSALNTIAAEDLKDVAKMAGLKESMKIGEVMFPMWTKLKNK